MISPQYIELVENWNVACRNLSKFSNTCIYVNQKELLETSENHVGSSENKACMRERDCSGLL